MLSRKFKFIYLFILLTFDLLSADVPEGFTFLYEYNGTKGGGTQFDQPRGMAINIVSGNSYVTSSGAIDNFQVFDSNQSFLLSNTGSPAFIQPYGIALDVSDKIYVVDAAADSVQVFFADGTHDFTFDGTLNSGPGFNNPHGIVVDVSGNIYVVDTGSLANDMVKVFDSTGNFQFEFPTNTGGFPFPNPRGAALTSSGTILISDAGLDDVQAFELNGTFLFSFQEKNGGTLPLDSPEFLIEDSKGTVYVSDEGNNIVLAFDSNGLFLFEFDGAIGDGDAFGGPAGIAVDAVDNLYVVSRGNAKVQVYGYSVLNPELSGKCKKNRFLTQTEIFNEIQFSFTPNVGIVPTQIKIFNGTTLLATLPGNNSFIYNDHNLEKNRIYNYTIVVEDQTGPIHTQSIKIKC